MSKLGKYDNAALTFNHLYSRGRCPHRPLLALRYFPKNVWSAQLDPHFAAVIGIVTEHSL